MDDDHRPEVGAADRLRDVVVGQLDPGAPVLAKRSEDWPRSRPCGSSFLPGLALGDEGLQVAEQELRVDRLAVVALAQRRRPAAGHATPSTLTPSGIGRPGAARCVHARRHSSRTRRRPRLAGDTVDPVRADREHERRAEGRADDGEGGLGREAADVDAADGDALREAPSAPASASASASSWSSS